jgi:hypothetical protein
MLSSRNFASEPGELSEFISFFQVGTPPPQKKVIAAAFPQSATIKPRVVPGPANRPPVASTGGRRADERSAIYKLAGTFGFTLLQAIAASLYDMLVATAGMDLSCRALVKVHARAAKLVAPGMPEISEEEAERLLSELRNATTLVCDQTNPCRANCAACPL